MANHHPTARSLVYGLSDFWTQYFKDLPTLEALYQGVEIDIGQTYLDLLTLLLNVSTQDAALFSKEYFKLIRIREDTVTFGGDGKHGTALGADIAGVKYLNNKVFAVTSSLENGVDFVFDEATRGALFDFDPFDAYKAVTFGVDNGALTVTCRQTGAVNDLVTINLVDDGTLTPTLTRSAYAITINYDGPANSSTTTAAALVALLNSSTDAQDLLQAVIAGLGTGTATVASPGSPMSLQRVGNTSLEGFATRHYDVQFGTRFTDPGISNWLSTDVQKGDVLRIIGGPGYGTPQEFPIALVREGSLLLYPQAAQATLTGKLEYAILRSPADDWSIDEPFNNSGYPLSCGTGNTVSASARTLYVPSTPVPFGDWLIDSVLELGGALNAGEYRIVDVLNPNTVVLQGNPLVDETNVPATLWSTIYNVEFDGVLTNNGDGTTTLYAPSSYLPACVEHAVFEIFAISGEIERYDVAEWIDPNTVKLAAPNLASAVGVAYVVHAMVPFPYTLFYSPGLAFPVPGTVSINARRLIDGAQVVEGRDYTVNYDLGVITPLTIWRTSITNRCTYQFRMALSTPVNTSIQNGFSGTLFGTTTPLFTDPSLDTSLVRPGYAMYISNTDSSNDGWYYVAAVAGPNTVAFTTDRAISGVVDNLGSNYWRLHRRGAVDVDDVIETVAEIGAWAVDAQVDRYSLYYSFGYLINRVQRSSESYRALIRGLFQLFMLGPTLERFEAAINTVAGLPTVRDEGEVLLRYDSEALRSGTDGVISGGSRTISSATAAFVPEDLGRSIYIGSGYNANKVFSIEAVLDATTVRVTESITSDSSVSWEVTSTGTHSIVTSRTRYSFPRTAPLKSRFTAPANYGVLTLHAFEVITAAFEVTDYVETPFWWERARIPAVLLPDFAPQRRQSTPQLYENVADSNDGACADDPGLYADADDSGNIPARVVLQSGSGDGVLTGDPYYPARDTEVFFESPTLAVTANDLGNFLRLSYPTPDTNYRIVEIVSPTRVKVKSYAAVPYPNLPALSWDIVNGTLAMRHCAAYVILDRYLKQHLFTVRFDGFLLAQLPTNVIQELQELVFVAKPTYTYLVLTPSTLFDDVVRITEDSLTVGATYQMAGRGGDVVQANDNVLRADQGLLADSWYRYVSNTDTFATPAGSVLDVLGPPDPGYERKVQHFWIDPTTFLDTDGNPLPAEAPVWCSFAGATSAAISALDGDAAILTVPAAVFSAWMPLLYVQIAGPAVNAGTYRIGRVIDAHNVSIYAPGATLETGLSIDLQFRGYVPDGATTRNAFGETFFVDRTGAYDFYAGGADTAIRRPFVSANLQRSWRVDEVLSSDTARLATRLDLYTDAADSIDGVTLTAVNVIFTPDMAFLDRYAANPGTSRVQQYYVEFTSGSNNGELRLIQKYLSPSQVLLEGAPLVTDSGMDVRVFVREHYDLVPEAGGAWEHLEPLVLIDNVSDPGEVTILATAAAGVATFEAYGVQEPFDPTLGGYDDSNGDTYYCADGLAAYDRSGRPRTSHDMDLEETPVGITVTPLA